MATSRKTRTISLTDEQDTLLDELVKVGEYQNASEVIREALRLLVKDRERHQVQLDEIRAGIREGLIELSNGRSIKGTPKDVIKAIFDEVRNENSS